MEKAQAGADAAEGGVALVPGGRSGSRPIGAQKVDQLIDGLAVEVREGMALPFPVERLRLEAGTLTVRAGPVAAELGEEDAHVHAVALALQPVKKPAHAIPAAAVVALLVVRLAGEDEGSLCFAQFGEGDVGADAMAAGGPLEITQALAVDLALKGADGTVVDGAAVVRDDEVVVDLDDPAKAPASRACAERRVEGKAGGGGRAEGLPGRGCGQALAVGGQGGAAQVEELEAALAVGKGLGGGLDKAGALVRAQRDAVLKDVECGVRS